MSAPRDPTGRGALRCATAGLVTLALLAGIPAHAEKAGDVRKDAFRLLNQGVAAYKRGDYATAVDRLERSSRRALNSFRAHFYLGLARIGDRRYAAAVDALNVALDLDPSHLQALVALGDAWLKQGDLDLARSGYYRALKLRPEYPAALDGLARVAMSRDEVDDAIDGFLRAIASDPGYAPAYTHLGDLYLERDRVEEAIRLLEEAVTVRPDFAPGLNRLARAYGRLGLDAEAVATIRRAMELEPNQATHRSALGTLQLGQANLGAAESWFLGALEIDDAWPEARLGLAEVARRRGDYELALGQVELALADARIDAAAHRKATDLRDEVAGEELRFAELDRLEREGAAGEAELAELAAIHARRGAWASAIELQRRAGSSHAARERLAYYLFREGRYREAHDLYYALAGETPSAAMQVNDGVSLAALGDDAAAVVAYERALEIEPDHLRARLYHGNALLRLGRQDAAVEAYKAFLAGGGAGEAAERIRRILEQIAPDALPRRPDPLKPRPRPPDRPPDEPESVTEETS